jgi:phosphatidylglycerophosphate synthase
MNLALLDSVQSARARGATTADVLGESSARRVLTTRDATWAIACARQLASLRVQPNAVSLGGVLFAMLAAGAFAVSPLAGPGMRAAMLVAAAMCVQLRLLCNLLDGMLAVEHGLKTPTGDIYNDLPDRVADVVILVGAGYGAGAPHGLLLGWSAAVAALFTAYVRVLGGSLGVTQSFIGPMAKQHRMFAITVAALLAAVENLIGIPMDLLSWALGAIVLGSIVTAARRTRRLAQELTR